MNTACARTDSFERYFEDQQQDRPDDEHRSQHARQVAAGDVQAVAARDRRRIQARQRLSVEPALGRAVRLEARVEGAEGVQRGGRVRARAPLAHRRPLLGDRRVDVRADPGVQAHLVGDRKRLVGTHDLRQRGALRADGPLRLAELVEDRRDDERQQQREQQLEDDAQAFGEILEAALREIRHEAADEERQAHGERDAERSEDEHDLRRRQRVEQRPRHAGAASVAAAAANRTSTRSMQMWRPAS
jgi:hypothetical protein